MLRITPIQSYLIARVRGRPRSIVIREYEGKDTTKNRIDRARGIEWQVTSRRPVGYLSHSVDTHKQILEETLKIHEPSTSKGLKKPTFVKPKTSEPVQAAATIVCWKCRGYGQKSAERPSKIGVSMALIDEAGNFPENGPEIESPMDDQEYLI